MITKPLTKQRRPISQTIAPTEVEIIDRYFAAQRFGDIPSEISTQLLENFGCKGAAPLPVRDFREKDWRVSYHDDSAWLYVNLGGSAYRVALASTSIHMGDHCQMAMIVGSPELDMALVILTNRRKKA
jgi:hypothetical protein